MYTRKIRSTGETLTVARATELNADATDGPWVTFCEDHKTIVNSKTEKLAYYTHGEDFCDGCRERIKVNPTNAKVNLNNHKEARAYQTGFQDALKFLVDALVEGGDVNYLIDALEQNANEPTRKALNEYYGAKAAPATLTVVEPEPSTGYARREFTNKKDATAYAKAQGGPVKVDVANPKRGQWIVTITDAA
ncbi:hypothetical protein NEBULOUS_30 [Microbacterium phage Nebulous]|nr:hypothetical protein NEBULOUS_30 [Microbacterium phage Nebulous]